MTRIIHSVEVSGVDVDAETRCAHYHGPNDTVAIKFACCKKHFSCHLCHQELAEHQPAVWPTNKLSELAVLCGRCGHQMRAREYLNAASICPSCGQSFNHGCAAHAHYYFAVG